MDKTVIDNYRQSVQGKKPVEVLVWALETFGVQKLAFASSVGAEDQVLTDMIANEVPEMPIFTLDTGCLHTETLETLEKTKKQYNVEIEVLKPSQNTVDDMVAEHGESLFRESVEKRKLCCKIRKVDILQKRLQGLDAWVCGLRRSQSNSRNELHVLDFDESNGLIKINPLADWETEDVWNYILGNNVPYNPLHEHDFPSIGCAPCTRAVKPGEDIRAGRWWWENEEKKECGLHGRVSWLKTSE